MIGCIEGILLYLHYMPFSQNIIYFLINYVLVSEDKSNVVTGADSQLKETETYVVAGDFAKAHSTCSGWFCFTQDINYILSINSYFFNLIHAHYLSWVSDNAHKRDASFHNVLLLIYVINFSRKGIRFMWLLILMKDTFSFQHFKS